MWTSSRFAFLENECADSRYAMAAHHLRDCSHIIEIGGYNATIDKFVTHSPKTITVIDPLLSNRGWPAKGTEISHINSMYQDYDYSTILEQPGKKGLLLMGVMLKKTEDRAGPNDTLEKMHPILEKIDIVIIETRVQPSGLYQAVFNQMCELAEVFGLNKQLEILFTMAHDAKYVHGQNTDQDMRFGGERTYRVYSR